MRACLVVLWQAEQFQCGAGEALYDRAPQFLDLCRRSFEQQRDHEREDDEAAVFAVPRRSAATAPRGSVGLPPLVDEVEHTRIANQSDCALEHLIVDFGIGC